MMKTRSTNYPMGALKVNLASSWGLILFDVNESELEEVIWVVTI